ncbi:hypothetical protein KSZ_31970 [Dictyobacter formicarum]|uniref:Replication-relaxation n=2 Tax=Dictyobacter formicarum TaxID=2778368 RepID=A0ABQ3VHN4_9CHLR|nr:hypothetical protein KSZ_31970 [Dictyobacter formicarum]
MVENQMEIPMKSAATAQSLKKRGKQAHMHYEPTELDYEILTYVKEYYLLSTWQLVNLHYAKGSKTRASTKLQILSGQSQKTPAKVYLYREALERKAPGNPTFVYCLATCGLSYLRRNGYPNLTRRFRPCETRGLSYLHKLHCLNVNDILIAARNLSKVSPDITLAQWRHDFDLQKIPAVVTFARDLTTSYSGESVQQTVRLVPDGMLDFRLRLYDAKVNEWRRVILFEVDRGTETNSKKFKEKILAYIHYCLPEGGFEKRYGKTNKRIAYIVTRGGEKRLIMLRHWCEEVLREQHFEQEQNLFRFTSISQQTDQDTGSIREELAISPTLFVQPVWYKPFEEEPDTLLWKP